MPGVRRGQRMVGRHLLARLAARNRGPSLRAQEPIGGSREAALKRAHRV